jgi:hypothetical protein
MSQVLGNDDGNRDPGPRACLAGRAWRGVPGGACLAGRAWRGVPGGACLAGRDEQAVSSVLLT